MGNADKERSMKILMYGDLQLSRKKDDYMGFMQSTLTNLYHLVIEREPDLLINLGDLFDTFKTVDVRDLVYGYQWMQAYGNIMKKPASHWILKGNHDIADDAGDYSTVQVMGSDQNSIFTRTTGVNVPGLGFVIVIPYRKDYEKLTEELEQMAGLGEVKAILAHVDWLGVRPNINTTHISTIGLDLENLQKMFQDVPIFTGHYHTPMDLGNLHVVGSPQYMDFNDVFADIPRGFTLWDTETGQIERIANESTYYCAKVEAQDLQSLKAQHEALLPNKDNLKVKTYVPTVLEPEADSLFEDFLWHATYRLDSTRNAATHAASVNIDSSVDQIVSEGVSLAGDELDKGLLKKLGEEAFAV